MNPQPQISFLTLLLPVLFGGVVTGVITAVCNAFVTSNQRSKMEGAMQEAISGLSNRLNTAESDIKRVEQVQLEHARDIASMAGSPRAKAAHSHV